MLEIKTVGGFVFGLGGSFDHEHAAIFGAQLRLDVEQQFIANAAALLLRVHGDPIEIVGAVGHGRRPEADIAVDAIVRVHGASEAVIFLFGLIEINIDQLEGDLNLRRREPVGRL